MGPLTSCIAFRIKEANDTVAKVYNSITEHCKRRFGFKSRV